MGNFTSCCYLSRPKSQTAKLLDARGKIREIEIPVTAAELMLEEPGHVVSPVEDIRRTRRILAMRADGELLAGKLYMLVPISRVNCVVSESEMGIMESASERRMSKRKSSKVLPAAPEAPVMVLSGEDTGLCGGRLGIHRKWRPELDPIYESC